MKNMIFAVAALIAVNANAATWEQIFANNGLIVAAPYATELGAKGIFNACSTGTALKTLTPVKVCTEVKLVDGIGDSVTAHTECVRTEYRTLTLPLNNTKTTCVEYKYDQDMLTCTKFAEVPYTISTTQSVDVLYNNEQYPQVAFTKTYEIPACAQ